MTLFPTNSIAGIFIASLLVMLMPVLLAEKKCSKWISGTLVAGLLVLLVLSNSRAGWMGCLTGLGYIFYRTARSGRHSRTLLFLLAGLLIGAFVLLINYKSGSTEGRTFIYQLSWQLLTKSWPSGTGFRKFRARFNEEQAAYFSTHAINSRQALLADNTFYAFNDYLQWVAETGLTGAVLLLLLLYLICRRILLLNRHAVQSRLVTAATAALLCVGVAALFAYPLQVISIQALALTSLAFLLYYPVHRKGKLNRAGSFIARYLFAGLCILFITDTIKVYCRKLVAAKAFELSLSGYRKQALLEYGKIIRQYPGHGDILLAYAEQLYYSNRLQDALTALERARDFYVDNRLYLLKARIENEMGDVNGAGNSYLHAVYMVPNRMASRVDLMNFYLSQQDTLQAIYWGRSVLNMPVKVCSEKTDALQQQAATLLDRINKQ